MSLVITESLRGLDIVHLLMHVDSYLFGGGSIDYWLACMGINRNASTAGACRLHCLHFLLTHMLNLSGCRLFMQVDRV